jgi:EAL domain-containing protein (putative c-di-GMP-specific phosphodiesterase class I)
MYQAKASGGGYRFYQAEMGAELDKRSNIAKRSAAPSRRASSNCTTAAARPGDAAVMGCEALLRWRDPVLGWISPGEFHPDREERGMMGLLGDWVLREACGNSSPGRRKAAASRPRRDQVSALQLEDPDIVGRLLDIVHEGRAAPERFELELTESSMMVRPRARGGGARAARAAGFGLSIDDFGTGYSSLSYLKRFAADHIKIDISFVRNMLHDATTTPSSPRSSRWPGALGLQTTAEGVRIRRRREALLALGCNSVQGFHFGHPIRRSEFSETWLGCRRRSPELARRPGVRLSDSFRHAPRLTPPAAGRRIRSRSTGQPGGAHGKTLSNRTKRARWTRCAQRPFATSS